MTGEVPQVQIGTIGKSESARCGDDLGALTSPESPGFPVGRAKLGWGGSVIQQGVNDPESGSEVVGRG